MPHPEHARGPGFSPDQAPDGGAEAFRHGRGRCCHGGPRWPLAAAAVGGAFWLFPPLGVASLAYLAMRNGRHGRGEGSGEGFGPDFAGGGRHRGRHGFRGFGGFGGGRRRGWSSGNAAFDEARAETWRRLEEEAEAFDDFRRRERMARDREVYDRFRGERAAAPEAPKTPDDGGPTA
ncbi:DUF2852 domain-containing protein [Pinisolibacter sp.]|uniref:DUF2852 domain-containing protein n=1 Tax=Pinisolibacter sp. TaxID=2172024 RepID=UPI002FDEC275